MRRWIGAGLLALCGSASAGYAEVEFDNLVFTLVPIAGGDPTGLPFAATGGFLNGQSFTGWPTQSSSTCDALGACTGLTIDANTMDIWGDAGITGGEFSTSLALDINFDIPDGYNLKVTGDLTSRMGGVPDAGPVPLGDSIQASTYIVGIAGGPGEHLEYFATSSMLDMTRDTPLGLPYTRIGEGFDYIAHAPINFVTSNGSLYFAVLGIAGQSPVSPIPEPSTYALMIAGLAAVVAIARRRGRPGTPTS